MVGVGFDRFTSDSRRAVVLGQEAARDLGHNWIGTEHLLLGILHSGDEITTAVLAGFDVTHERTRKVVEELVSVRWDDVGGHLPFTRRAKRVMELALRVTLSTGCTAIEPRHLLLGIIRESEPIPFEDYGRAMEALVLMSADPVKVQRELLATFMPEV